MPRIALFHPSNRIREMRKQRGLTLQIVADRIRSTPAEVSRIERGERGFRLDWGKRIASALNCSPADLLLIEDGGLKNDERALIEAVRTCPPFVIAAIKAIVESQQ